MNKPKNVMHEFPNGKKAAAHQHKNGKGWVEKTASVDPDCFVGPDCYVLDKAVMYGSARLEEGSSLQDFAKAGSDAVVRHSSLRDSVHVYGGAIVANSRLGNNACVGGRSRVFLSHVLDCADIYGDVKVTNSAVRDRVRISDSAVLRWSEIGGYATVRGNAKVAHSRLFNRTSIYGNACVVGVACDSCVGICGTSRIGDQNLLDAEIVKFPIEGRIVITGSSVIRGPAVIPQQEDIISVNGLGSRKATLTAYFTDEGRETIEFTTGCFCGSYDMFVKQVRRVHPDSAHKYNYLQAAKFMKSVLEKRARFTKQK